MGKNNCQKCGITLSNDRYCNNCKIFWLSTSDESNFVTVPREHFGKLVSLLFAARHFVRDITSAHSANAMLAAIEECNDIYIRVLEE